MPYIIASIWIVAIIATLVINFLTRTKKDKNENNNSPIQENQGTADSQNKKRALSKEISSDNMPPRTSTASDFGCKSGISFKQMCENCGWVYKFNIALTTIIAGLSVMASCIMLVFAIKEAEFLASAAIVFISAVLTLAALAAYFILCAYFYHVARDKGYKRLAYMVITYFCPEIGIPLIIALPDRGNGEKSLF